MKHFLYERHEVDAPDSIRDRNGTVCLALCRLCGKAEAELNQPCLDIPALKLAVEENSKLTEQYEQWKKEWQAVAKTDQARIIELEDALHIIAEWNSHDTPLAVGWGSNGVRDYYRKLAVTALGPYWKEHRHG